MPASPQRVAIASADSSFRGALAAAMSDSFSVHVIEMSRGDEFVDALAAIGPTILIHDGDGDPDLEAVRLAAQSVPVLVLGPDESGPMIEAVEAGALGYAPRDLPFSEIEKAAIQMAGGVAVIPPFMLGSLLHYVVQQRRAEASARQQLESLTPREREVFELAAIGLSHDEVANRLFVSPATARTHLHRIFKKLEIHSKAELVGLAASCGFPTMEEM